MESKPRSIHPHPQRGEAKQQHGLHKHLLMENGKETHISVNVRITLAQLDNRVYEEHQNRPDFLRQSVSLKGQ